MFWLAQILAAGFLVGALRLGWEFRELPQTAGNFTKAGLLQANLFAYGFAIGISGTAIALTASTKRRRVVGTVTTLYGFAFIIFGFVARHYVEQLTWNSSPSALPLMIPALVWLYSFVLIARARPSKTSIRELDTEGTTEEQPQPLSRS